MSNQRNPDWHDWFAWYPVYSTEIGWVWFRLVRRKLIPIGYRDPYQNKPLGATLSEALTGSWHRIPEHE